MRFGPWLVRLRLLLFVISASASVGAAPEDPYHIRGRERTPEVFLNANLKDPVLLAAVDLLQPYVRGRPRAATFRASDYPDLPLAGLSGARISCSPPNGSLASETIYINVETNMFRLAANGSTAGLVGIAATLIHEMRHGTGSGEADAYAAEAAFVRRWLRTESVTTGAERILDRFVIELEKTASRYSQTRDAAAVDHFCVRLSEGVTTSTTLARCDG